MGATIEDLDISDLNEALQQVDNQDVTKVFTSLKRGSYNHLKAFVKLLEANGVSYQPVYISVEEFESIISSAVGSQGGNRHYRGYGR